MSQSPYTPRQQAFISALAIPFTESDSEGVFNPSIPLVNQDHLVPDWVEMGVIGVESTNIDKQALILKGVDACVTAFESADPATCKEAVFAALHNWAENDLRDSDFKIDQKYDDIAYALKEACREQVPIRFVVAAHGSDELLSDGLMVVSDLNQMIVQIESVLSAIQEHGFQSVNVNPKGYCVDTFTPEDERLYGEELNISPYGTCFKNMHKDEGAYESTYLDIRELKAIQACAIEDGIACIDVTDREVCNDYIMRMTQKNDPLTQDAKSASQELG